MKILNLDDMLDISCSVLSEEVHNAHLQAIEAAATALAESIAKHFEIKAGEATYESGFGGLCATFRPSREGQECPTEIEEGDTGGDWE